MGIIVCVQIVEKRPQFNYTQSRKMYKPQVEKRQSAHKSQKGGRRESDFSRDSLFDLEEGRLEGPGGPDPIPDPEDTSSCSICPCCCACSTRTKVVVGVGILLFIGVAAYFFNDVMHALFSPVRK